MKILVVCLVDVKRFCDHSIFNSFQHRPKLTISFRDTRGLRDITSTMPPSKQGRKRRPSRSSSSSPRDNDPNQPTTMTEPARSDSPGHQGQADTPSPTPRFIQLRIQQALNKSRVKDPSPFQGPFDEEIKALQTVFPSTFEQYQRQ